MKNLEHKCMLKEMILRKIEGAANSILETHLVGSILLNKECPSEEASEQVKALKTICSEIREQMSKIDKRSSHQTSLETLSHLDLDTLLPPTQEG